MTEIKEYIPAAQRGPTEELPVIAVWHDKPYNWNQYDMQVRNQDGKIELRGLASTYLTINREYAHAWLNEHTGYTGVAILCHLCARWPRIW